jgi:hypothetical protein
MRHLRAYLRIAFIQGAEGLEGAISEAPRTRVNYPTSFSAPVLGNPQ